MKPHQTGATRLREKGTMCPISTKTINHETCRTCEQYAGHSCNYVNCKICPDL